MNDATFASGMGALVITIILSIAFQTLWVAAGMIILSLLAYVIVRMFCAGLEAEEAAKYRHSNEPRNYK